MDSSIQKGGNTPAIVVPKGGEDPVRIGLHRAAARLLEMPKPEPPQSEAERLREKLLKARLPAGPLLLPDKPPVRLYIEDDNCTRHELATPGNLVLITGKAKSGKSALVSSLLSAHIAAEPESVNALGYSVPNALAGQTVVHIDTEQGEYEYRKMIHGILNRAGLASVPEHLHTYSFADYTRDEKVSMLDLTLSLAEEAGKPTGAVFIDNIAHFLSSVNEEKECIELAQLLLRLARKYNTVIYLVLHTNHKGENRGARGAIGTTLEQMACYTLEICKEDGFHSVKHTYCRSAGESSMPVPQFRYCAAARDFVFDAYTEAGMRTKKKENDSSSGPAGSKLEKLKQMEPLEIRKKVFGKAELLSRKDLELAIAENLGIGTNYAKLFCLYLDKAGILQKQPGHLGKWYIPDLQQNNLYESHDSKL